MKYFQLFCFTLVLSLISMDALFSQDTIVVQTFDWNSSTRNEVFDFPDDPNATYRKILMKYNMRCHDAAVGSGSVGCREWDYSCNTFITDSTRVDSTRQVADSHSISNFSQDTFLYTATPTFTYTVYEQHETDLTIQDTVQATIGDGQDAIELPLQTSVGKLQYLYTAEELMDNGLSAGPIEALSLLPTRSGMLDFLLVRMALTNEDTLSVLSPPVTGWESVYHKNTVFEQDVPKQLPFYQAFDWDGSSNVIVELSYTNSGAISTPAFEASATGYGKGNENTYQDFALHFSGVGNVEVPADKFSTISDEITISLWSYGTSDRLPVSSTIFEGADANNDRQANVHLPWGNGIVYWDCGNDGSGYDRISKAANESDYEGGWNHWAFTKNANSGEMKIYLNGALWHEGTGKNKLIDIQSFFFGSNTEGTLPYFGSIDELRIWNEALDEETIALNMLHEVASSTAGLYGLTYYYQLDEGTGTVLQDPFDATNAATAALPTWQKIRGVELFKNFDISFKRVNLTFYQGTVDRTDQVVMVLDSIENPLHQVIYFGVDGTDLVRLDTQLLYPAGYQQILTESGMLFDSVWSEPSGTIAIQPLTHYTKSPSKYEILSLVTPYGNGLSLGNAGKTFTFDVTDYAPILRGTKRMSIEMGGQWQEELDITFLFITGTPDREVLDIQNIWPFRRGGFQDILSDRFFEPRNVTLPSNGSHFKIRSAITGHGQNGEFVPRNHYINLAGGTQEFTYDVWKECADNPIYPQGGTWIFDRAGWCPGAATDVHEFDITNMVDPGGVIELDYGLNGAFMEQANYLVSNQLVTYGAYQYAVDASIERIARPNHTDVEFERINPACSTPLIWVKNTGSQAINSLEIAYTVRGNSVVENYTWTGVLSPAELVEIELPVLNMGFWDTPLSDAIFEAHIVSVNGAADEEADNNQAISSFETVDVYENDTDFILSVLTNNNGSEYSYTIKNAAGEIMMERDNMMDNTTYDDELNLPPGCYTFEFDDAGDDGLSFWFFPDNGSGLLRIMKYFNSTILLPVRNFDTDFGTGVQYDFVVEEVVGTTDDLNFRLVSTYPNPASNDLHLDLKGFENEDLQLEVTNLQGYPVMQQKDIYVSSSEWQTTLSVADLPAGMYYIKLSGKHKVWVRDFVKH